MDETVKISLDREQQTSQNFSFLRDQGLEVIQRLAPDTWTDHNVHDPGITLLEAIAYTLTEAGSLNNIDMPDLLASGGAQASPEFFTPAQVLPSSPVTTRDFQKILIDHPLINKAWVFALYGEPLGRWSMLLEFENAGLNSNLVSGTVNVLGVEYRVEFAFPYWDDPEAIALQQDVLLQNIVFINPLPPWQVIGDDDGFFARIQVTYLPQGGAPTTFDAWVVAQITTPVSNPVTDTPAILLEISNLLQTLGDNSPADQTILKQYNRRVIEAFETSSVIKRYLNPYRNLAEIFFEFSAARLQEVAIIANIEVAPNINVETLLADIFYAIDNHISPEVIPDTVAGMQKAGVDTSVIFDGPLNNFGIIPDALLTSNLPSNKIYTSDIVRLILQLRRPGGSDIQTREDMTTRSIIAVYNLSLSLFVDNRKITQEARECLQLINSIKHISRLSPGKCQVRFFRNDVEVNYDIARAIELFRQKKQLVNVPLVADTPDIPISGGTVYPVEQYYPVQNNLPVTYGVGVYGLPVSASAERKAQAKQLKGYLFFFEQILAGYYSQLAHLNSFFSANPQVEATLFQQPLYHLPAVQDLFADFDPLTETWESFQADEENGYRTVLKDSLETGEQFLDRRHRMLDHLLARQGENLDDFTAMAHRESYTVPNAAALPLPQLQAIQQQNRLEIIRRLIRDKSAFFYDLPTLHERRLQSYGLPSWSTPSLISIEETGAGFAWQIHDFTGAAILMQANLEPTETAARIRAQEVLALATSIENYSTVTEAGGALRLVVSANNSANATGTSIDIFNTQADADLAITTLRENTLRTWVEQSLSSLEIRLYHLLGIQVKESRRELLTPVPEFFELFDDAFLQRRFRLRQLPGPFGNILFESEIGYPDNAAALVAVSDTIRNGILSGNYTTDQPPAGPFGLTINGSDGNIIARFPGTFSTSAQSAAAAESIRAQLYRFYSREGFYMVEHILLSPVSSGDINLVILDDIDPCQPVLVPRKDTYSFQLTFVFPSGFARDFSAVLPVRQPSQPDRFRDAEFRAYTERTIRNACPGHILPVILWVDSVLPGTVPPANAPAFDNFEINYRQWLAAFFTDRVTESVLGPARNNLVNILNALYADANA